MDKAVELLDGIHKKSKNEVLVYLNFLKVIIKDLYQLSIDSKSDKIKYSFLNKTYKDINEKFPKANWLNLYNPIDILIRDLSSNAYPTLSIYSLIIDIHYCLKGNRLKTSTLELIKDI